MITLQNKQNEYIFTKVLDNEDMNMKIVTRIDTIGDKMNHTTNVKADTTLPDIIQYPEFQELSGIINEFCRDCSNKLQYEHPNHVSRANSPVWYDAYIKSLQVSVMWGTRYESGEVTIPHNHWPNTWAFCYYIDPPENCSGLIFPDSDYELKIENGMLVLFSGHMIHNTLAKEFRGNRYCVSGVIR